VATAESWQLIEHSPPFSFFFAFFCRTIPDTRCPAFGIRGLALIKLGIQITSQTKASPDFTFTATFTGAFSTRNHLGAVVGMAMGMEMAWE